MGKASKLALDPALIRMREIVLRAVRNMNPAFAECGCKNACARVDRDNLVGVSDVRAHIFYGFKLSHAVSGLPSTKNGPSVSDLMRGCNNIPRIDLFILTISGRKTKNPRFEFGRRDDGRRVENNLPVDIFAFWKKTVNVVAPTQRTRTKVFVQIGPDLQVDDAVKSAVVVLWINRLAVIDHREKSVILRHALKRDVVSLICEVLRYRQATSDVSEPQMIDN